MSFRGRGAPRGAGGFRGGSRGGGRGGGAGGGARGFAPEEPPQSVVELGVFMHACEGEMICKNSNEKVSYADVLRKHGACTGELGKRFAGWRFFFFCVFPLFWRSCALR